MFAGPICVTDGRYSYYRFPAELTQNALPLYTVMPSHLESMFSTEELSTAELVAPFDFTKGAPLMRMTMSPDVGESGLECVARWNGGSCLFDLKADPRQEHPIEDAAVIARLTSLIVEQLRRHDAPREIFAHYGLEESSGAPVHRGSPEFVGS
jgi:hypothetical protein